MPFKDIPFRSGTVERDEPPAENGNGSAIALPSQLQTALSGELEKLRLNMELKLAEERKLKSEDLQDNFRNRVTAMMAAAVLSEGAAGNRPQAKALAQMAVEYADAVLDELKKPRKE